MEIEKLIAQIMQECEKEGEPVTKEEAREMAEMELNAKKNGRRYEGDTKKRKTPNRAPKIDSEKVEIIESVAHQLTRLCLDDENLTGATNITIANKQREITFTVGANEYSLTLTKHRKKQVS